MQLVVVGGDYDTTTGNVYTSFLNQNSTSEFTLGLPYQQVITTSSECNIFNFSVYSNESHNCTLFLTTQENPVRKSAREYFMDHMKCHTQHGFVCDDIEINLQLSMIPLFILIDLLPYPPGFIVSGDPIGCQCHPVLPANGLDCVLNHVN